MSEELDEHKGSEPDPKQMGTPEDDQRLQSILKVDTKALLGVISQIEQELSQYQKQDEK